MKVEIVRMKLEATPELAEELDPQEKARAARFFFERDRARFIAAHGLLRRTLGAYLDREPRSLRFEIGPYGKPSLADSDLEFNLSHSGDRALIALASGPIGVDLEQLRPHGELRRIAEQMFAPGEQSRLGATRELCEDFYRVWTLKESFIKSLGEGLSYPLDTFDVDVGVPGWTLRSLEIESGFAAAVAVKGVIDEVVERSFDEGGTELR